MIDRRVRTFRDGYKHAKTCDGIYRWSVDPYILEVHRDLFETWLCDCRYYAQNDEV